MPFHALHVTEQRHDVDDAQFAERLRRRRSLQERPGALRFAEHLVQPLFSAKSSSSTGASAATSSSAAQTSASAPMTSDRSAPKPCSSTRTRQASRMGPATAPENSAS